MAAPFKKTVVQSYPRVGEKITSDTLYWKSLEFPITKKEFGSISHIDFSPVQPYNIAATSSSKVQIVSVRTNQTEKTLSKFKEMAHGGCFRGDGKLLVAGSDEKLVKLFDVSTKSLLRVFRGHSGSVHVTKFTSDNLHILSGSDDCSARLWDIPSESQLICYNEHKDYVRCAAASQTSKDIIITGSYDHTVKLYDTRAPSSVFTVDHGSPVESVLMFPGGTVILSAGGSDIKVWDALGGGRLMANFSNHHKTVTCMCFCSNYQRLVSGSLDRHVKIYDVTSYQVVHSLDFPAPVMSLGIAPDDSVLAVGMSDGLLSIQHRNTEQDTSQTKKKKTPSFRYVVKGHVHTKEDHVVAHKRKEQLTKYDKFFKRFEYSKALDAAVDLRVRTKTPEVTVSVFQELIRRDGLRTALAGREDMSLNNILKFLQKNISNTKFMTTIIDVSVILLDLYSAHMGQSSETDSLIIRLKETVDTEVSFMKQLLEVMGTLDTVFASTVTSENSNNTDSEQLELQPTQEL